jgi:Rv2525c-like, glycoside hydrolase-like domain
MSVIDTNDDVSGHLDDLRQRGVVAIGRYYSSSAWKRIGRPEALAISKAGMSIFVVFENDGDPELKKSRGTMHANIAKQQAQAIGQPPGSAVYFALEHLPSGYKSEQVSGVEQYMSGVKEVLDGIYKVGAYSDGVVLNALLSANLIDYAWLSASLSFEGSKSFLASGRWAVAQDPHVDQNWDGLSVDLNQAKPDFGSFQVA